MKSKKNGDRLSLGKKKDGVVFPVASLTGIMPKNYQFFLSDLMRAFAAAWPDKSIVQRVIAQIPWRSNIALLDRKPMGVAQWQTKITRSLPKELKSSLPTIEEIEKELGKPRIRGNRK